MKLLDLDPTFYKRITDVSFQHVDSLGEADGVCFQCPLCWQTGKIVDEQYRKDYAKWCPEDKITWLRYGVHYVMCWDPRVPQTTKPVPGRWVMSGTGFGDLTLTASSSSILLTGEGCKAHFYIRNGEIQMA